MTHKELTQLLLDAGFDTGWALSGETLVLWEHDTNPPAPLVRPMEATDEALSAHAVSLDNPE